MPPLGGGMEIVMKKRDVKITFFKIISILTVFSLLTGIFSAFPSALSPVLNASAESSQENIYSELPPTPPSVLFDADDMEGNMSNPSQTEYEFITTPDGVKSLSLAPTYIENKHDPYISFAPQADLSADEYKYITLLVKTELLGSANFTIYFNAGNLGYSETTNISCKYSMTDQWQLLVYDLSAKDTWEGKINSIRFDYFNDPTNIDAGVECNVAAVIFSKTPADVYDSAFDLMQTVYPSVQKLSDFTEDELKFFERAAGDYQNESPWRPSLDNVLSGKDGNLLYTFEYDTSVEHGVPDPYSGFFYDELADARGIDKLTTEDFRYTVMRYRTSGNVGASDMQLFYYANGNKWPTFIDGSAMAPSVKYTASTGNDWKTLVVDMASGNASDGWKGDFSGFRVDWCSPSSADAVASMEISDILFFKDGTAANAFSAALNQIKLAIVKMSDDYDNPIKLSEDCLAMLPEELNERFVDSDNTTHYIEKNKGVSVLRLGTVKTVDSPFITFKPGDINADEYKYITLAIKKKALSTARTSVEYKTEKGTGFYYASRYDYDDNWQLVTIDLANRDTWGGIVDELKISYFSDDPIYTGFAEHSTFDIAGIVFSKNVEELYDSAYYLMVQTYRPAQVLTSFTDADLPSFNNGPSCTDVSAVDGYLHYEAKSPYSDPFAGFLYKNLMDSRGVAAEDRLTTADFCATVIRYRTPSVMRNPGMQFFIYTGDNYKPFQVDIEEKKKFFTTSANYTPTNDVCWSSMSLAMNGDPNTAKAWTGDFNGFRVDWCGSAAYGEYMDISEFFFFKDKAVADRFTAEVNSVCVPVEGYDGDKYMEGIDITAPEDVLLLGCEEMEEIFVDSNSSIYYIDENDGIPVMRMTVTDDNSLVPSVTLRPENISADEYKYITFAIRSDNAKSNAAAFKMYYTTQNGKVEINDFDGHYFAEQSYIHTSNWQIITLNLSSDVENGLIRDSWSGMVDALMIEYFSLCSYDVGDSLDIAAMAFLKTEEEVFDVADYLLTKLYRPVQVLADFTEDDLVYFGGTTGSGYTILSAENGNIKYTATGTGDVQKHFNYFAFADAKSLNKATTDVFQHTVIRYKAQNVTGTNVKLFILTGENSKDLFDMVLYDYYDENNKRLLDCHSGNAKYQNTDKWSAMTIDMAATDGKGDPEKNGLKFGWHREDGDTTFKGFRFDWGDSGGEGAYLEVSQFAFFADGASAQDYSNAINGVRIPLAKGDPIIEEETTTETQTTETVTETTKEETIPPFEDTTVEQSEETLPPFPQFTDEPIIDVTEESNTDVEDSSFESELVTEDVSETDSLTESEATTESDTGSTGYESETVFETEIDSETEGEVKTETETETEVETETETEIETETETEAHTQTEVTDTEDGEQIEGLRFELNANGDGYTVYGNGATGDVVIPSTYNGLPVTAIGYGAFEGCSGITSITIPDTVVKIGDGSFRGCTGLESVYFTGSETEWSKIEMGKDNSHLSDRDVIFDKAETTGTESGSDSEETSEEVQGPGNSGNGPSGGDVGGITPDKPDEPASGSQMPFYIACVMLAALSVASIVVVIVIKIKNKACA